MGKLSIWAKTSSLILFISTTVISFQNCAEQKASVDLSSMPELEEKNLLVYGDSQQDQEFFERKVKGYKPPAMSEIFNKWATFSGANFFANLGEVKLPSALDFCTQGGRDENGDFLKITDPTDSKLKSPLTITACLESPEFSALTWSVVAKPERLYTPFNSNYFIGFVSPLVFDEYIHQTTLTSPDKDDDAIMMVIAAAKTKEGDLHILAAARAQGGWNAKKSWSLVHVKNGKVVASFSAENFQEEINKNQTYKKDPTTGKVLLDSAGNKIIDSPGSGDFLGWNGRKTRVKVERNGNNIRAFTTRFVNSDITISSADFVAESEITLDLGDSNLQLEVFKGPQSYGWGSWSQAKSQYLDDEFETNLNDQFIYNLSTGAIFEKQPDGTYNQIHGVSAIPQIGYPRKVLNPETGSAFHLEDHRTFIAM